MSRSIQVISQAVAIGLGWLVIELMLLLITDRSPDLGETLGRFFSLLPWQLILFALFGGVIALADRVRSLTWVPIGWITIAFATALFLGARMGEGELRGLQGSVLGATLTVAGIAAGVAVFFLILGLLGTRLPSSIRSHWPPAIWIGWGILFLSFMRRAAAAMGFGVAPPKSWGYFVSAGDVVGALVATGTILLMGLSPRLGRALAVALLLAGGVVSALRIAPPSGGTGATADRPNVVVILIDTLRADHLAMLSNGKSITPAIDELASEAIRFRRAYSPSNNTLRSMPGIMTALSFSTVGAQLPEEVRTFAEYLRDEGYSTYGISANPIVSRRLGYAQGFDEFSDSHDWATFLISDMLRALGAVLPGLTYHAGVARGDLYYRPASEIRRRALRLLERAPEPTFLYLQTMDMHGPYLPDARWLPRDYNRSEFLSYFKFIRLDAKKEFQHRDFKDRVRNLRQRYAGELRFTDEQLGLFFDALRKSGRWDETAIWLLSDHGESFGEHGSIGHGGHDLSSTLVHVPFLLKPAASWNLPPQDVDTPVSTHDLVPTTLALLGAPIPPSLRGVDLSNRIRSAAEDDMDRVVISEAGQGRYSVVQGTWKLNLRVDPRLRIEEASLYDLANDPEERFDVIGSNPKVSARIMKSLHEHWDDEQRHAFKSPELEISPEVRGELRRLGYLY